MKDLNPNIDAAPIYFLVVFINRPEIVDLNKEKVHVSKITRVLGISIKSMQQQILGFCKGLHLHMFIFIQ